MVFLFLKPSSSYPSTTLVYGATAIANSGGTSTVSFTVSIDAPYATYNLQAACSGFLSATSSNFAITTGTTPTQLAFTQQPVSGSASSVCSSTVIVTARDDGGNTVTSYTGTVSLDLMLGSDSGTMTTVSVSASSGVASFSSCTVKGHGTFRLQASGSSLKATSNEFSVTAGTPTTATFTTPSSQTVGTAFSLTAQLKDSDGILCKAWNQAITLKVSSGPGSLVNSVSTAQSSGVLSFTGVQLDTPGSYTLAAYSGSTSLGTVSVTLTSDSLVQFSVPNPIIEQASGSYYQISLVKAPSATVTVKISSDNESTVKVLTQTLSFTTSNTYQTVKVSTSNSYSSSTYYTGVISHAFSSSDKDYDSTVLYKGCLIDTSGKLSLQIYDRKSYSITLDTSVVVQEGTSETYSVRLGAQPTDDVVVSVSYSSSLVSVSPISLTFTNSNWSDKTFTVTSSANESVGSSSIIKLTHSVTTTDSNYSAFGSLNPNLDTYVALIENDKASIVVADVVSVMKDQTRENFFVYLGSVPTSTVTVALTVSDSTVTVWPTSLTFTSSDYFRAKPVTVNVKATSSSSTTYAVTVTHTATSSDSSYSGMTKVTNLLVVNYCDSLAFTWPSTSGCAVCPKGFDCSSGYGMVACPAGYYNSASSSCTICPAGSKCPDPTASSTSCSSGYYSIKGSPYCRRCPAGWMCPNQTEEKIAMCQAGQYSTGVSTSCSNCSNVCPSIYLALDIACPAGSVQVGNSCRMCPRNYSCSGGTNTPSVCSSGKYSPDGSSACTDCPAFAECIDSIGVSRSCPEGTSSSSAGTGCALCTAGSYCSITNKSTTACASGYYSLAGASSCLPCPPGYSCSTTSVLPTACTTGQYQNLMAQTSCSSCPSGYFTDKTGSQTCTICPAGYYCASLTAAPVICGLGTYSYVGSTACSSCMEGYLCPPGSVRPDPPGRECPPGYNCPVASSATSLVECGGGTYNPFVRGRSSSDCYSCLAGFYCPAATAEYRDFPCTPGNYCTASSTTPTECPVGTFNPVYGAKTIAECRPCTQGFYCPLATAVPSICQAGYICPLMTTSSTDYPCPAGTYNGQTNRFRNEDCLQCPPGAYCPSASTAPTLCEPGTYNPTPGAGYSGNCYPCPPGYACPAPGMSFALIPCKEGYFCPPGTVYPHTNPCPAGTFSDSTNLYSSTQCQICPQGKSCHPGTTRLTLEACATGHYCPPGTKDPYEFACPPGFYTDQTDRWEVSQCISCPAGKACPVGTATPANCAAGYYCPINTQYTTQYRCPQGTYSSSTSLKSADECTDCSVGNYCPAGTSSVINCPAGLYTAKVRTYKQGPGDYPACQNCPAGYKCASAGTSSPVACGTGQYSEAASTSCSTCVVGYYCHTTATSLARMNSQPCPAGSYCAAGTDVYPSVDSKGCSTGKYCPEATTSELSCPIGTYRNTVGARSLQECTLTPAGYYTDTVASVSYTSNQCSAGYYCPEGSTSATPKPCPIGTYREAVQGASSQDCVPCPGGTYCPSTGTSTPTDCPQGSYCPEGSYFTIPCPRGSYGAATKLKNSNDCKKCDPGKYCEKSGLTTYTGNCLARYYCKSGAWLATPTDGSTGGLCPAGGYCTVGTTEPTSCPDGQFNSFEGAEDSTGCIDCPKGYYCQGTRLPSPTGKCNAGYYCTGGSSTPQQYTASAGYYAPEGSVDQVPCAMGTFNPNTAAESCTACEEGKYCPSTQLTAGTACPVGFYCPTGSAEPLPCPPGTYRATEGAKSKSECTNCDGGKYCEFAGKSAVTGDCAAGYYCKTGSPFEKPGDDEPNKYGPCPKGSYCVAGTTNPVGCSEGTYNPSMFGESSADCLACPSTKYCKGTGLDAPTGQCRLGYYCDGGATTDEPSANTCDPGEKCPQGSASAIKCPAGTYQTDSKKDTCNSCPAGYYCPPGTGDYTAYRCPTGYYCPSGTANYIDYPCDVGTYNENTLQTTSASCISCKAGYYCVGKGQSAPTGLCAPGYYCSGGAMKQKPVGSVSYGARCQPGQYCPEGSVTYTECKAGFYCPGDEMEAVKGPCQAGYFCNKGSKTPAPTDGTQGNICPKGYYCPEGSSTATRCPAGTYMSYKGAQALSECIKCTPGYYCDSPGTEEPTQLCTGGYYCPEGTSSPSASNQCPKKNSCPTGSAAAQLCSAGTYQNEVAQVSCNMCGAGYFCEEGSDAQSDCPKGSYCPTFTKHSQQYVCDIGTYNPVLKAVDSSACLDCPGGKYCSSVGASGVTANCEPGWYCTGKSTVNKPFNGVTSGGMCIWGQYCPSGSSAAKSCDSGKYCPNDALSKTSDDSSGSTVDYNCAAGFFCISGAKSPYPTDGTTGDICNKGHYCPERSSSSLACSKGKYAPVKGISASSECIECPYGKYCATSGLASPTGACSIGYYCTPGQSTNIPSDLACDVGFMCPSGAFEPQPCVAGEMQTAKKQGSCTACTSQYYCAFRSTDPQECSVGYECPSGTRSDTEFPCAEGDYSDEPLLADCKTCPAGSECHNAAQDKNTLCPVYKYCLSGTAYGSFCPAGYYNNEAEGASALSDCLSCDAGFYCVDGRKSGVCEPGYWCKGGSPTPTPADGSSYGELCPKGNYCEKGVSTPTKCPDGKFRRDKGGRQITDCTDCPPGFYCEINDTTPKSCPKGYYCPQGSQAPTPCPIRQFSQVLEGVSDEVCSACPAGFWCTKSGISDYTKYPCKVGFYCVEGAKEPTPCPPGTYTTQTNIGRVEDCSPCPQGYYCIGGLSTYTICPASTYCPRGSSYYKLCPPGSLCTEGTGEAVDCPAGSYCEKAKAACLAQTNSTCSSETYCPTGSFWPTICPEGKYAKNNECVACDAGYYSNTSTDGKCVICNAGHICTGGANRPDPYYQPSEGGYACPKGYYCLQGALVETACPAGTYNNVITADSLERCLPCPADYYNDYEGQAKCKMCGSNAGSIEGSNICTCLGKFRAFQKYDGSCRCFPTYEFRYNGKDYSNQDSAEDCAPKVYARCQTNDEKDAEGDCVANDDCEKECGGLSGQKIKDIGICECDSTPLVDDICDEDCRNTKPTTVLNSEGIFEVTDPYTNITQEIDMTKGYGYFGSPSCSTSNCTVHSTEMTSDGPEANFGVNSKILSFYKVPDAYDPIDTTNTTNTTGTTSNTTTTTNTTAGRQNRNLQVSSEGISNPVWCIKAGDTMLFSVSRSNYPVYNKDSLLNTNRQFNYGAFSELDWLMSSASSTFSSFAFTFDAAGIYDFVDSNDAELHMIVAVKGEDETCSDPAIMARTTDNLGILGVSQAQNVIEDPEWGLVALLLVMSVILLSLVVVVYSFMSFYFLANAEERKRIKEKIAEGCSKVFCKKRRAQVQPDLSFEDDNEDIVQRMEEDTVDSALFKKMLEKLKEHQRFIEKSLRNKSEEQQDEYLKLLERLLELKKYLRDELGSIDPVLLQKLPLPDTSGSEDELIESPEKRLVRAMSRQLSRIVDAYASNQEDLTEASRLTVEKSIFDNPELLDQDKAELLEDFNAGMQRIENAVNSDRSKAEQDLQQRLAERKARRQKAISLQEKMEREKAALAERHRQERQKLNEEKKAEITEIEKDFASERDRVKKENRADIEKNLEKMRAQLQRDLAGANSKAETDSLLRAHDISAKRMESQLTAAKAKQEQELLARIEERRKQRQNAVQNDFNRQMAELKQRQDQEAAELESGKAQLDIWQLDMNKVNEVEIDATEAEEMQELQRQQLLEQQRKHEAERLALEKQLAAESLAQSLANERQRLEAALQASVSEDEKQRLVAQLANIDQTQHQMKGKQSQELEQRLKERQLRRAEAELRKKQEEEAQRLQAEHEAQADLLRTEREQLQIIETLKANSNLSPAELMALVRKLLSDKHDRETTELMARKHSRLNELQNQLLKNMMDKKTDEVAEIRSAFKQQIADLEAKKLKQADHDRILASLTSQQSDAIAAVDYRFINDLADAQNQLLRDLEDEFRQKFLGLADAHMKEASELLRRVKNSDVSLTEAHMLDLRSELDLERTQIERRYFEKLKELDERRSDLKYKQRQREAEVNELDREVAAMEAEQKHLAEIERRKQDMLQKQQQVMAEMKRKGISKEELDALIEQHNQEVLSWDAAMEAERKRQKDLLQGKLAEREERYKQRLQERIALYKEENLELMKRQEEEEQKKLKVVNPIHHEPVLYSPVEEIESQLKIRKTEVTEVDEDLLKLILKKVKVVEKVVKNVDTTQFEGLMTSAEELDRLIRQVRAKVK